MSTYHARLENQVSDSNHKLQILANRSARLSNWRALTMLLMLAALFLGYQKHPYFYGLLALGLPLFIALVIKHQQLRRQQALLAINIELAEKYLARFTKAWEQETGFEPSGERSATAQDLNLFGGRSLHHFIDRTILPSGQARLQDWLQTPLTDSTAITDRQAAIQELSLDVKRLLKIQAQLLFNYRQNPKNHAPADQLTALEEQLQSVRWSGLANICTAILVASTLTVLGLKIFLWPDSWPLTLALNTLIGLQILSAFARLKKQERIILQAEQLLSQISPYLHSNQTIIEANFKSPLLQKTHQVSQQLASEIKRLQTISTLASFRHQGIAWFFFNALFQIDFATVYLLKKWQRTGSESTRIFVEKMADLEALISLTTLPIVRTVTYPDLHNSNAEATPALKAEDLKHPLLPPETAIGNDFDWQNGIKIITGSNMSGKSTFLKTVGINALLAQIGAPVTAAKFSLTPMKIYTSMDIHDNLSEGISTFYEEILRIKTIVNASKAQETMLVLIDEIFKGTNSQDRLLGAVTLLKQLNQPSALVLVSTHDLEICDLAEQSEHIANYHFTETFAETTVAFDYRLKSGRSTRKNARRLLAMAGVIIPEA